MSSFYSKTLREEGDRIFQTGHWDYEWSIVEVHVRRFDGAVFLAETSGCSCYGPGDNITSWDDMVRVTDPKQVLEAVNRLYQTDNGDKITEGIEAMSITARALRVRGQ